MPTPVPLAFDSTELRRIADTLDNLAAAFASEGIGEPRLEVSGAFRIAFPERVAEVVPVPLRRITPREDTAR